MAGKAMWLLQVPGYQAGSEGKLGVFDCCQGTGCHAWPLG